MSENKSLILLNNATKMLAEVQTIDDAKNLMDIASAAKHYAKKHNMSKETVSYAQSIEISAEIMLGEFLNLMQKNKGAQGIGTSAVNQDDSTPPTYKELGISRNLASEAQALATMPAIEKEEVISGEKSKKEAKKNIRKKKQVDKENKAIESIVENAAPDWIITDNQDIIECDVLITDPPYGILNEIWEPGAGGIEDVTRLWATRWSKCGANIILTFFSQRFMWLGKQWFDESLYGYEFQQLLIWHYPNNKSPQNQKSFKQTWEPIFFYRHRDSIRNIGIGGGTWGKDFHDFDCHVAAVPQSNFNDAERKVHPAQKPVSVMRWLINATTIPGELVVDPFCGSGTTGIAAIQLGRKFHGIETDLDMQEVANKRIACYGRI